MRLTTFTTAAVGCHADVRQAGGNGRRRSVDGVGGAGVAAFPVRDVREAGAAV